MTVLQEKILELLKEIDEICRNNEIVYYLSGGTALGAIRHKGFLPWDDDADIYITRQNYNKFIEVTKGKLKPDRELLCNELNPDFPYPYARYIDINTTAIYRSWSMGLGSAGISVDFVLMDDYPNDEKEREEFLKDYRGFFEYAVPYYLLTKKSDYTTYKKYLDLGNKIGKKAVIAETKKRLYKPIEGSTHYFQNLPFWPHILDKKIFGTPKYVPFEDMMCPVAENVVDYLRIGYEDDWSLIPATEHIRTHITTLNPRIGYSNFFQDAFKFFDRNKTLDIYEKRKQQYMALTPYRKELEITPCKMQAVLICNKLERKIKNENINLEKMFLEKQYDEILTLFSEYYNLQFNKDTMFWSYFVPINDDILYYALLLYIVRGEYYKARKIINLRIAQDMPLTDNLNKLNDLICCIRDTAIFIEKKDYSAAGKRMTELYRIFPDLVDFVRTELYILRSNSENTDLFLERTEKALVMFPNDGEIMKLYGDALIRSGNIDSAYRYYSQVCGNTNNGMIMLELREWAESCLIDDPSNRYALQILLSVLKRTGYPKEDMGEYLNNISENIYEEYNKYIEQGTSQINYLDNMIAKILYKLISKNISDIFIQNNNITSDNNTVISNLSEQLITIYFMPHLESINFDIVKLKVEEDMANSGIDMSIVSCFIDDLFRKCGVN